MEGKITELESGMRVKEKTPKESITLPHQSENLVNPENINLNLPQNASNSDKQPQNVPNIETVESQIPPQTNQSVNMPQITSTPFHNMSLFSNPQQNAVVFHSVGNIPVPKFKPKLETAEHFLKEVEHYLRRKKHLPEDWLLVLPSIFNQEKSQSLWWHRTKLIVNTWDEFKEEFKKMYGSETQRLHNFELLLKRRQKESESFQTFALEMEMVYRKLHPNSTVRNEEILNFISERSLPYLKPHLLASKSNTLIDLINFAETLEMIKMISVVEMYKVQKWQKGQKISRLKISIHSKREMGIKV